MFYIKTLLFISFIIVSDGKLEPFIVGGQNASIDDFSYAAHLGIQCTVDGETISWMCGASIINAYMTLTAAHCLYSCSMDSLITVSCGHENFNKGTSSSARTFMIHQRYNDGEGSFDIGLVRLNTKLTFSDRVSRVALMGRPPYREEALVAGWGVIDEIREIDTNILQFTKQYVWERQDCWNLLQTLTEGTICARDKHGSSYAAIGDSGSALVVRGYIQIGLVSHKLPVSSSVVVYTDTGYFYKWIKRTSKQIMCI